MKAKVNIDNTRFIFDTNFSGDPNRDRYGSSRRRVNVVIPTEEQAQQLEELIASVERTYSYDKNIMDLVMEESAGFFAGTKTAEQTASLIQDRVSIYVNEQR